MRLSDFGVFQSMPQGFAILFGRFGPIFRSILESRSHVVCARPPIWKSNEFPDRIVDSWMQDDISNETPLFKSKCMYIHIRREPFRGKRLLPQGPPPAHLCRYRGRWLLRGASHGRLVSYGPAARCA